MRRFQVAAAVLSGVIVAGTLGYWLLLDFSLLDAAYQTVTTITTVGFREVRPLSAGGKVFTMVLIVLGAGAALYTFGVTFETLLEGELTQSRRNRRMGREITKLHDHVVVCGWGRVGRAIAAQLSRDGQPIVVVDVDPDRLEGLEHPYIVGDATDDTVLTRAGLGRARALIAAIDTDAANLYITLSGRSLRPDLFIIARARDEGSESKLRRAGADRVVNPQAIGGARMAAFVSHPHVAEFLDLVTHHGQVEFRLAEVGITERSALAGLTLAEAAIPERTGALILAMRTDGDLTLNPRGDTRLAGGHVLIVIGTPDELDALEVLAR